jgi:hypothetical protein
MEKLRHSRRFACERCRNYKLRCGPPFPVETLTSHPSVLLDVSEAALPLVDTAVIGVSEPVLCAWQPPRAQRHGRYNPTRPLGSLLAMIQGRLPLGLHMRQQARYRPTYNSRQQQQLQ